MLLKRRPSTYERVTSRYGSFILQHTRTRFPGGSVWIGVPLECALEVTAKTCLPGLDLQNKHRRPQMPKKSHKALQAWIIARPASCPRWASPCGRCT